jgi:hypothetical protein
MRLGRPCGSALLGLEEFGQHRIMEQLAARIAAQRLRIAVPRHVHDLSGRPGVERRHGTRPVSIRETGTNCPAPT